MTQKINYHPLKESLKFFARHRKSPDSGLKLPKNYEIKAIKLTTLALTTFLITLFAASILAPVQTSKADSLRGSAATTSSSALRAQVNSTNYSLNLTSSNVLLSISATPDGSITAGKDTVTVSTNNPAGYRLYLATNSTTSTSNNLYLDNDTTKDSINAINGSFSNPVTLTNNTWGYALNKSDASTVLSYLDITPTTDFSDSYSTSPSPNSTWAGVPVKGKEQLIKITNEANTDGSSLDIYYGVKATNSLPSGTYFGTIQYTAIAEAGGVTDIATISPEQVETGLDTTLTITTSLNTDASNVPTSDATVTIGEGESAKTCPVQTVTNNDSGTINITCTAPEMAIGTYTITIFIDNYLKTYAITDGLEYIEPTKQYFQDFTVADCQALTTNETITLYDKRDGNDYTVAKLGDGNCWQTQNMRLGADPSNAAVAKAFTLTSSNSNVSSSFTVEAGNIQQNTGTDSWSGTYDAKHIYLTGDKTYGNYYNWYTATAGTGTQNGVTSGDASASICPASGTSDTSWKLPSITGNSSYITMFKSSGVTSTTSGTSQAAVIDAMRAAPYSFTFSGDYQQGVYNQGSRGQFWSRTTSNANNAYYFYFDISGIFNLDATLPKHRGFSVRCVLVTPTLQDFTIADCQALTTNETITLYDKRDGNDYTVAKLGDGNCWTTQNLRLGADPSSTESNPIAKTFTLTSANSNVSSDFEVTADNIQTSGDTSWGSSEKRVYVTGDANYGNYYNWYTATAGSGLSSTTSGDVNYSICPSSGDSGTPWRLPTNSGTNNSYTNLFKTKLGWVSATSGTDTTHFGTGKTVTQAPYSFPLSGRYGKGASGQESTGDFWSRTAYGTYSAYSFGFHSSGSFYLQGSSSKDYGSSVRCVLVTS